jgi:hypothetical protein
MRIRLFVLAYQFHFLHMKKNPETLSQLNCIITNYLSTSVVTKETVFL